MPSILNDILSEWEGGCFYSVELLAEAYTTFLSNLVESTAEERTDLRVIPFLLVGYTAYSRFQNGDDPQAALTYRMALAMCGAGSNAPPRPTTPPARCTTPPVQPSRPATPPAGPSRVLSPQPGPSRPRSPSPQPGPSKRPREEDEEHAHDQPTLEVLESRQRHLRRFKATFREETMIIKGLGNSLPSEDLMASMFDTVLQRQRDAIGAKDDDRVILEIQNGVHDTNPIWFSMRRADQINGGVVLDKLTRVLNSNQSFMTDGELRVSYIHVPTPRAGGRRINRVANESMESWLERKISQGCIYSPSNNDNMCLTRCVAVASARISVNRHAFHRVKNSESIQKNKAETLCDLANINKAQPCGIDEVRQLQDALPEYRLCVFSDKDGKECLFKGPYAAARKNIYLVWHAEHFYTIFTPGSAFDYHFECEKCVIFYNNVGDHRCEGSCWRCLGPDEHTAQLRRCNSCGHQFAGDECYENHRTLKLPHSRQTKCDAFKFCNRCKRSYSLLRGGAHVCGFVYCRFCKNHVAENHLCYMQRWEEKEKNEKWSYHTVVYDIESSQCDPVDGRENTFEHRPILLVSQIVCDECSHITQNDYFCLKCKTRQHIFHCLDDPNISVMGQFIDYLQSFPAKTALLLVAHNAKAYDAIFVLQEMIARKLNVELTLQGAKIICMKVKTWKFVDSLMFLPMPLSAMPKAFGLDELKKGYWPFLACKPEFYGYEGPLLDKSYYCVSTMKSKAADDFNAWYDAQVASGYVFNFRKDLIEYCISDVTILRQSCQAFRKLFEQCAGFDPMFHCITLSSACMCAYRRNFLPPNKIGLVPDGGYHGRGKQSHIALRWLDFEAHKIGRVIKTIYTDREVSILGRRVDGYVEIPHPDGRIEKRVYQFHGCYWHQCPIHFPTTDDDRENRYERTQALTALFKEEGYTVVEKWECVFNQELKTDPETKAYFEAHPTTRTPPLVLRDALVGGRTSALRWYYKADLAKGERINMADVVSEYPNANLRGEYPYGHPKIYLEGDRDIPPIQEWNGMVKCTVLPPRDLFIPVLPFKAGGKLMFPLCRTCVETENKEICQHENPLDRQLTSTWCAPELLLALREKSYQLIAVHEVHQYPGTMAYNPETGEDGLLSAYVRCFMALKMQASGWPAECDTDEKKDQYVKDTLKHDGVTLDPTKMKRDMALRTLSKLICNSFWGKFGEKTLRSKTEIIYDYSKLLPLITNPKKEVTALVPLSEDCLQVTWKPVEDSEETLPTSSILHAAFTTCFGRLQLYKYLDIVKERALYHDTDSVAYISRPGEPDLPLGTHLGDLTDQVEEDYGPGSFITEFAAGGPKNYAYKVAVAGDLNKIKVCIKVRGITINRSCDDLITFENLKAMVMGEREKIVVPIPHQIARLPTWQIVTRSTSKNWQAVNSKRRRVGVEFTVPHGYNAWTEADEEDQGLLEAMDLLGDA